YFEAIGMAVRYGRGFLESDQRSSPLVAIIDEALARRHWPMEAAVGQRIHFGRPGNDPNNPWMTIVGVVASVKDESLGEESAAHLYLPYTQADDKVMDLIVRTAMAPEVMTAAIQKQVWELDAQLPLFRIQTMERTVAESLSTRRWTNILLAAF